MTKTGAPKLRRRLSAQDAREAILSATEKRLREHGPDALRLQAIASDVGLSHPTVLHHIGSREDLVREVVHRAIGKLESDLLACFTEQLAATDIVSTLHHVDEVLRAQGQARLVAWLALTEPRGEASDTRLGELTAALHSARAADGTAYEDTAFAVVLAATSLFGAALLGPSLLSMTGLGNDEKVQRRFREWLAGLLLAHAGLPSPEPELSGDAADSRVKS